MINKKGKYELYYPKHSQDMNYHLIDTDDMIDYLIDICDVTDDKKDLEYLLWDDLKSLNDIEYIKSYSWKRIKD